MFRELRCLTAMTVTRETNLAPAHVNMYHRSDLECSSLLTSDKTYVIDVSSINNFAKSHSTSACKAPLATAAKREKEKFAKYAPIVDPMNKTLVPFVIEMGGGLGKKARDFLRTVRKEIKMRLNYDDQTAARHILFLRQHIACVHRKAYLEGVQSQHAQLSQQHYPPG